MEHPNKEIQANQKEFLSKLDEAQRAEHARLFRVGNATYRYHRSAEQHEPTEIDYREWLEGLPELIRKDMGKKGFDKCKGILSFTRYVNEKNDVGMDEWMRQNLNKEDFEFYSKNGLA